MTSAARSEPIDTFPRQQARTQRLAREHRAPCPCRAGRLAWSVSFGRRGPRSALQRRRGCSTSRRARSTSSPTPPSSSPATPPICRRRSGCGASAPRRRAPGHHRLRHRAPTTARWRQPLGRPARRGRRCRSVTASTWPVPGCGDRSETRSHRDQWVACVDGRQAVGGSTSTTRRPRARLLRRGRPSRSDGRWRSSWAAEDMDRFRGDCGRPDGQRYPRHPGG